jgi:hypothetical protein
MRRWIIEWSWGGGREGTTTVRATHAAAARKEFRRIARGLGLGMTVLHTTEQRTV